MEREKKFFSKDPRLQTARAFLVPTALLLTLGIVISSCSFLEEFGKGTFFRHSSNRVIFQGVGIGLIVLGALGGLSMHILHKSVRTQTSVDVLKKWAGKWSMTSQTCQCGKPHVTQNYFTSRQEKGNKIYSRSTDNTSKLSTSDLGEPTYYFPPVEIHAYDIKLWELKCSGESDDDNDNNNETKGDLKFHTMITNSGTNFVDVQDDVDPKEEIKVTCHFTRPNASRDIQPDGKFGTTKIISENEVMTAENDNAVLIKDSTKNEEHQEEGTSTKDENGSDRLSYANLMKDYNIEMSESSFDFRPFEET